jgi:hypothetical protein
MTRLFAAALLALAASVAASADDKKRDDPIAEIPTDKADKFETKGGSATKPHPVRSAEDLEQLVKDEDTRKRLAKRVDFQTHTLLVFAWEGSGQDKLGYSILESYPEQVEFAYKPGATDDLRRHVRVYALRKNVRSWSVK